MDVLSFEVSLDDLSSFWADAVLGDSIFEVLVGPRDLRQLRATIMDVARYSGTKKDRRGILILDEPQLSENRLREEWASVQEIFRPEILHRLALVIHREGAPDQIIGQLGWQELESIPAVIEHGRLHALRPMRRPSEAFLDILRLLVVHWFRQTGPLTSKELCAQSGFSYPTVSGALERLEPYLARHSDRRIELRSFPRDAWFKLVAQAEKVRTSQGYTDRSGRPRPPEVLVDRLRELGREDIGVAGVLGARHYLPGLDLMGTPRLDLVVHSSRTAAPNDFLRRLDPALKPVERGETPQVVVHTLYRPETLFTRSDKGNIWADEVECLLDLHEMRLESQALEFVERLTPKPKP
jgi:hypothetical protein